MFVFHVITWLDNVFVADVSVFFIVIDEMESLMEENRQLRQQRLCKICLEVESTIAFLPCGDVVCCVDCAPAMRKCPVCRTHVKGTVKTYLA